MTTTPTVRTQLLKQFKALLTDGEAAITHIEINRPTAPDLENVAFPAAFIYSGRARRLEGVVHEETFEWEVMIALWAKDQDIEELLGRVQQTLASDTALTLNGVADRSWLIDAEPLTVDDINETKSFLLTYEVEYHHPFGQP